MDPYSSFLLHAFKATQEICEGSLFSVTFVANKNVGCNNKRIHRKGNRRETHARRTYAKKKKETKSILSTNKGLKYQ